ncbi:hypothetical protein SSS_02984 [Sarcoptes scabiei]|uniref:Uncharacterized protein n=1 Tax=Sarcoptes scabiei TaxID=52283 RepID=A0A834RJN9_SARSC|nr:hypothetical protein SSS_02984 [Sarcoptes scabiei]
MHPMPIKYNWFLQNNSVVFQLLERSSNAEQTSVSKSFQCTQYQSDTIGSFQNIVLSVIFQLLERSSNAEQKSVSKSFQCTNTNQIHWFLSNIQSVVSNVGSSSNAEQNPFPSHSNALNTNQIQLVPFKTIQSVVSKCWKVLPTLNKHPFPNHSNLSHANLIRLILLISHLKESRIEKSLIKHKFLSSSLE